MKHQCAQQSGGGRLVFRWRYTPAPQPSRCYRYSNSIRFTSISGPAMDLWLSKKKEINSCGKISGKPSFIISFLLITASRSLRVEMIRICRITSTRPPFFIPIHLIQALMISPDFRFHQPNLLVTVFVPFRICSIIKAKDILRDIKSPITNHSTRLSKHSGSVQSLAEFRIDVEQGVKK